MKLRGFLEVCVLWSVGDMASARGWGGLVGDKNPNTMKEKQKEGGYKK